MTETLQELERNRPTRPGKDLPAVQYNLLTAIIFSALSVLLAALHIANARRHHLDFWQLNAFGLCVAVSLPWVGALASYTKLKKSVLATEASVLVLRDILVHGSRALEIACMALSMTLLATFWLH